ncbi:transmembrane protein 161B [Pimephales promelas]|nr:transmembrane protein 161B [Pimephales promelas]
MQEMHCLSAQLVARGLPACLRAVAAAERAVVASREFVGYSDLTLLVPHAVCSPRPDLTDEALPNSDMILYVDGSSSRDDLGKNRAGYAEVAVCKCQAHTTGIDEVSRGNRAADLAAKAAALLPVQITTAVQMQEELGDVEIMQQHASPSDKEKWRKAGCVFVNGQWRGPNNKPCLPSHFFQAYAKLTHGLDHVSKSGMFNAMQNNWFTKGFSTVAADYCSRCMICGTNNVGRGQAMRQAGHPIPQRPFSHVMLDYIELTQSDKKKYCIVAVDIFSKWVEAMPTAKADAKGVAKLLLQEIVPRWGIPEKLSSDNGSHFVNSAISAVEAFLGTSWRRHCVYFPEAGGAIERENQTIKNKLTKICEETGLPWPKALPIELTYMRMRKRGGAQLSPFEILFGRPPHMGWEPHNPRPLPDTTLCEHDMLNYCVELDKVFSDISRQVKAAAPVPAETALHSIRPGDFVLIKDLRRKHWKAKRWQGPFQVLLTTHTAVKVGERALWIHGTHCRKVPAHAVAATVEDDNSRVSAHAVAATSARAVAATGENSNSRQSAHAEAATDGQSHSQLTRSEQV